MLRIRLLLIGEVILHCLFLHIEEGFLVTAGVWGRGDTFSQPAALCSILMVTFQSLWIILAVFRKENVSNFWEAIDSVQEPFGI